MNTTDKGTKAKHLLEDEAFKLALSDVEAAIIQKWRSLPIDDREGQWKLKVSLSLLGNLEANLRQYVSDMEYEEFRIEEEKRPSFLGDINEWTRKKQEQNSP